MAELLVRVAPKDPKAKLTGSMMPVGGVVAVMPDGHDWTKEERTHPDWRIVKVPDLPKADAESLTAFGFVNGEFKKRQLYLDPATVVANKDAAWAAQDPVFVELGVKSDPPVVDLASTRALYTLAVADVAVDPALDPVLDPKGP